MQIVDNTTGNDHFYLVGGVSLIEVIMEDLLIARAAIDDAPIVFPSAIGNSYAL